MTASLEGKDSVGDGQVTEVTADGDVAGEGEEGDGDPGEQKEAEKKEAEKKEDTEK